MSAAAVLTMAPVTKQTILQQLGIQLTPEQKAHRDSYYNSSEFPLIPDILKKYGIDHDMLYLYSYNLHGKEFHTQPLAEQIQITLDIMSSPAASCLFQIPMTSFLLESSQAWFRQASDRLLHETRQELWKLLKLARSVSTTDSDLARSKFLTLMDSNLRLGADPVTGAAELVMTKSICEILMSHHYPGQLYSSLGYWISHRWNEEDRFLTSYVRCLNSFQSSIRAMENSDDVSMSPDVIENIIKHVFMSLGVV